MRTSHLTARSWVSISLGALVITLLGVTGAGAQSTENVCADVLMTASPTEITDDADAVAITSQQFEADVPGWTQVSWEAADETALTAVSVRTEAETFTLVDDIASGTVDDVLELIFCGTSGTAQPGDEPTDDGQVTQPVDDVCDDVLVTITPDTIEGDETTVAITAQQLDADVDGWLLVSWEAAEGTTLTGVTVRTATGTMTLIDDVATGTVRDTLELTFCGSVADDGPDDGETPDGNGEGDDGDEVVEVPDTSAPPEADGGGGTGGNTGGTGGGGNTGTGGTGGTDGGGNTGTGGTGGSTGGGTSTPAPTTDSGDDGADAVTEPEPDTSSTDEDDPADADDDAATAEDDTTTEEEDDTEVLGVQLTQDDEGTGWLLPIVLIVLVGGAIAAGVIVRNRYLAASEEPS